MKKFFKYNDPYEGCGPEEYVRELRQRDSERKNVRISYVGIVIAFVSLIVSIIALFLK